MANLRGGRKVFYNSSSESLRVTKLLVFELDKFRDKRNFVLSSDKKYIASNP